LSSPDNFGGQSGADAWPALRREGGVGMSAVESQQVSWWDTHVFIAELVAHYNNVPVAGTPRWCALDGSDPRKLIAVAIDGVHHVLRKETAQQARAEASRDVCSSADWAFIARSVQRIANLRESRPWMNRAVSR